MADLRTGLLTTLKYKTFTGTAQLTSYLTGIGLAGLKERVVGVYAVPSNLINTADSQQVEQGEITNGYAKSTNLTISRPSTIDGYTPKNKKLLTYPYVYATVSTGTKEQTYVFEKSYVDSAHTLSFNIYGVMGQGFKVYIVPYQYDHIPYNFNCAFEDEYPQMAVAITPFVELLGNNGIVSKLLPLALTAATLKVPPQQALPPRGDSASPLLSGVGSKDSIAGGLANLQKAQYNIAYEAERKRVMSENAENAAALQKLHVASHIVPQIGGTVDFNNLHYTGGDNDVALAVTMSSTQGSGTKIKGVHGMVHSIRYRDAQTIDDFFTVYGYTCDKVKVPNVHVRTKFTYTKTQGCRIKPKGNGVPAKYMVQICAIFDSGITFWDKSATIGDYGATNSIITVGGT